MTSRPIFPNRRPTGFSHKKWARSVPSPKYQKPVPFRPAGRGWQHRILAIKGLDGSLFVQQHTAVQRRRVQLQPNNVGGFFPKVRLFEPLAVRCCPRPFLRFSRSSWGGAGYLAFGHITDRGRLKAAEQAADSPGTIVN